MHVPYRGTPEALRDTMNGVTDICFCPIVAALPMIKQGRVVALANGSPTRSSVLPELATTEEQGFADSGYTFWVGLFAPAGTPRTVIDRLNAEARRALEAPEVKERLQALGTDPSPTTPAGARVESEAGDTGQLGAGEEGRHPAAVSCTSREVAPWSACNGPVVLARAC